MGESSNFQKRHRTLEIPEIPKMSKSEFEIPPNPRKLLKFKKKHRTIEIPEIPDFSKSEFELPPPPREIIEFQKKTSDP